MLLAFLVLLLPARALALIVPDDVPTLQAALDSGAEEILIRPGLYPETPEVNREVVIRALLPGGSTERPRLMGLILDDDHHFSTHSSSVWISDLHFTGPVRNVFHIDGYSGTLTLVFENCVMDSGVTDEAQTALGQLHWAIRNCTIEGGIRIRNPEGVGVTGNVVRGSVDVSTWDAEAWVSGNTIEGTGAVGLRAASGSAIARVVGNTVRGFDAGIVAQGVGGSDVRGNRVEDCSRTAVRVYGNSERCLIGNNVVRRCGRGIYSEGHSSALVDSNLVEDCGESITLVGPENIAVANTIRRCEFGIRSIATDYSAAHHNLVEDCQREGITANGAFCGLAENHVERCGGHGIAISGASVSATANRVVASGGVGLIAEGSYVNVERNVIGHGRRDGITIYSSHAEVFATSNTSYANQGSGLVVRYTDSYALTGKMPRIRGNLSVFNDAYGLDLNGPADRVDQGCNDWFGNVLGDVMSPLGSGGDLSIDPMLCDAAADDAQLMATSPLLAAAGCGLIGALGQGCADTVSTPTLVTLFGAQRTPQGVRLRWQFADRSSSSSPTIERAEERSGPWAPIVTTHSNEGDATVETDATALEGHAYWYRLVTVERILAGPIEVPVSVADFELGRVGPNPTSGPLRIEFAAARRSVVDIGLFDVQGRLVATLMSGETSAGQHAIEWRGAPTLQPGVYLIRYRHPHGVETRRVALTR